MKVGEHVFSFKCPQCQTSKAIRAHNITEARQKWHIFEVCACDVRIVPQKTSHGRKRGMFKKLYER